MKARPGARVHEDASEILTDGKIRVVIEAVRPEVDAGRFPIKRVVGEMVEVEADIFTDGHDAVRGVLCYRHHRETRWQKPK